MFRYIVEKYEVSLDKLAAALDDAKQDGGKALMGTIAERWEKQGEAKGEARGLAAGEILGREKGLAEGLYEGEAKSLMWLLVKRVQPPAPACRRTDRGWQH